MRVPVRYWTATPTGGKGAGVGQTTDDTGYHWEALPGIVDGYPRQVLLLLLRCGTLQHMLDLGVKPSRSGL